MKAFRTQKEAIAYSDSLPQREQIITNLIQYEGKYYICTFEEGVALLQKAHEVEEELN